jgi:hypothetical protein
MTAEEQEKLRRELMAFKSTMDEWILFLDRNQREMKARVLEMEHRIRELEKRKLMDL